MSVARVQARGQVTVPQEIREACGIEPGTDLLFVRTRPGEFECRVLPPRESLAALLDEFAMDGPAPDMATLREAMGDDIAREHHLEDRTSSPS